MNNSTLKYLYFDTSKSIYKHSFKIHKYKNASYLSLKANDIQVGYTLKHSRHGERPFLYNVSKVLFFGVNDLALLEQLYAIRLKSIKILFSYTIENSKMELNNFTCVNDISDRLSNTEVAIFPKERELPFLFDDNLIEEDVEFTEVLKTIHLYH